MKEHSRGARKRGFAREDERTSEEDRELAGVTCQKRPEIPRSLVHNTVYYTRFINVLKARGTSYCNL